MTDGETLLDLVEYFREVGKTIDAIPLLHEGYGQIKFESLENQRWVCAYCDTTNEGLECSTCGAPMARSIGGELFRVAR